MQKKMIDFCGFFFHPPQEREKKTVVNHGKSKKQLFRIAWYILLLQMFSTDPGEDLALPRFFNKDDGWKDDRTGHMQDMIMCLWGIHGGASRRALPGASPDGGLQPAG